MSEKLSFKNGTFRIMCVGDPHLPNDDGSVRVKSIIHDYLNFQYACVDKLKPDFVVVMGDNCHGYPEKEFIKNIESLTSPYSSRNIPFTLILGNHDVTPDGLSLEEQYKVFASHEKCILNSVKEISPAGDYYMPVYSDKTGKPTFNLWFMYSGDRAPEHYDSKYAFITNEQIEWYENNAKKLAKQNDGKVLPAILFQHIPVCEEYELLDEVGPSSLLKDGVKGEIARNKNKYYVMKKDIGTTGYMGEAPCTPDFNNGQFESWKKTGDIFAAFFGHDHLNDFLGTVDGITLGQCKTASFKVYGDGLMQGVRIIDINENNPRVFKTSMVYYRELIGTKCESIKGTTKWLRDRTSVKLEASLKVLGCVAAVGCAAALTSVILKKKRK